MRVITMLMLAVAVAACEEPSGAPPPSDDPGVVDSFVRDGLGDVVDARCPMPVAAERPLQRVIVWPIGTCADTAFAFPRLVVRDREGRDVFAGVTSHVAVSTTTTAGTCAFQVQVSSVVPPEKPDGEPTTPPGVDVRARLCLAQWSVQLPIAGLEPPVLRDLFFVGEGGAVIVPGQRTLPVAPPTPDPVCLPDTPVVDVEGYVQGLGFTVEVPLATLARTQSTAMGGQALITFDIQPR